MILFWYILSELTITVSKDSVVPENDTAPEVLLTFSNEFATSFTVNVAIGQNVTGSNPPGMYTCMYTTISTVYVL